jgi:hypothetical protein
MESVIYDWHKIDARNHFPLCADAYGVRDEIVSVKKVSGTCSDVMLLLVQEPI